MENISTASYMMLRIGDRHAETIEIISCGLMLGSSIIFPTFYTLSLESGPVILVYSTLVIYLCAASLFAGHNYDLITRNGPYTFFAGVLVYLLSSPREQVQISLLPLYFALGLIITVHVAPKVCKFLSDWKSLFPGPRHPLLDRGSTFRTGTRTVASESSAAQQSPSLVREDAGLMMNRITQQDVDFAFMGSDLNIGYSHTQRAFDPELGITYEDLLSISSEGTISSSAHPERQIDLLCF